MHHHHPHRSRPVQTKPITLDSARVDELYGLEPVFDPAHPRPRRTKPEHARDDAPRTERVSGVHAAGTTSADALADPHDEGDSSSDDDSDAYSEGTEAVLGAFVEIQCPACWETQSANVDLSAGPRTYIEDCLVCCHPMELTLVMDARGELTSVTVTRTE